MFGAGDTERRLRTRFANATSLRHQGTLSIVFGFTIASYAPYRIQTARPVCHFDYSLPHPKARLPPCDKQSNSNNNLRYPLANVKTDPHAFMTFSLLTQQKADSIQCSLSFASDPLPMSCKPVFGMRFLARSRGRARQ